MLQNSLQSWTNSSCMQDCTYTRYYMLGIVPLHILLVIHCSSCPWTKSRNNYLRICKLLCCGRLCLTPLLLLFVMESFVRRNNKDTFIISSFRTHNNSEFFIYANVFNTYNKTFSYIRITSRRAELLWLSYLISSCSRDFTVIYDRIKNNF